MVLQYVWRNMDIHRKTTNYYYLRRNDTNEIYMTNELGCGHRKNLNAIHHDDITKYVNILLDHPPAASRPVKFPVFLIY